MKAKLVNDVRRIVILFAGFAFGIHVAVFLHECGHALGGWLSGGVVVDFVMQAPLPAGYVQMDASGPSNPFYANMLWWGGVTFGSLAALAPLLFARRTQTLTWKPRSKRLRKDPVPMHRQYCAPGGNSVPSPSPADIGCPQAMTL